MTEKRWLKDGQHEVIAREGRPNETAASNFDGVVEEITNCRCPHAGAACVCAPAIGAIISEMYEFYRREHNIAEHLQMSFLPQEVPETKGFEIGHHYKAALDEAKVGGDFYDVFALGGDSFGVVIADAAGKGLKAAMYSAMTKHMLRAYALEDGNPETVLARLNAALSAFTPPEVFVTLVYGVLDVGKKTFVYANAGHEPLIVYSGTHKSASTLDLTGNALAVTPSASYVARTVTVEHGDAMLLYTDGLTDAGWGMHRMGHDRVLNVLEESASQSAPALAESLITAATHYAGGKLGDDAAILIIKRPENRS